MITYPEIILRLLLAVVAGGLIGLERETHGRPAGFRTHILVCLGAALVMLVSIYGFQHIDQGTRAYDPGRLAAQVVSGIGFLGAGTILREGVTIRGLTTAASLWVIAGIGLAIGSGFYLAGVLTTLLAGLTLIVMNKVEQRFLTHQEQRIRLRIEDKPGRLANIAAVLGRHGVDIKSVNIEPSTEGECYLDLGVEIPRRVDRGRLLETLSTLPEVQEVRLQ